MDASREQFVRQTRRPISLLRRSGLGSVSLRPQSSLLARIRNPHRPDGRQFVRSGRVLSPQMNRNTLGLGFYVGLPVISSTGVLLRLFARMCNFEQSSHEVQVVPS